LEAELQQFAINARRAPKRVISSYISAITDEIALKCFAASHSFLPTSALRRPAHLDAWFIAVGEPNSGFFKSVLNCCELFRITRILAPLEIRNRIPVHASGLRQLC
jgi:hypothetical protein